MKILLASHNKNKIAELEALLKTVCADAEVVSPGYQASFSHGYYKKLNYVQLRNITLGYRVNQKFVRRIGLSAIDVNFSVNNVCAFSNMRQMLNYDNTWFASFPTARSYVLGLTLTF